MIDSGNSSFKSVSRIAGIIIILGGGLVFVVGWMLQVAIFQSLLPNFPKMVANTALGFVLSGISLSVLWGGKEHKRLWYIGQLCASITTLLSILTLSQYLFGWNLGIDQLLFIDSNSLSNIPGRPSPQTAVAFVFTGLSLILLSLDNQRSYKIIQSLSISAALVAILALIGYLYSIAPFFSISSYTGMSLLTAILFVVLSVGILFIRPDDGLISIFLSDKIDGLMARRLLPTAFIIPFVLGWLILRWIQITSIEWNIGISFFVLFNIITFATVVWRNAILVRKVDQERSYSEIKLQSSEMRLDNILQLAPDAIISIDNSYHITRFNLAAERVFGYEGEDILGKSVETLLPERFVPIYLDNICRFSESPDSFMDIDPSNELYGYRKDGSEFPMEVSVSKLNQDGEPMFSVILRDITERKAAQQLRYSEEQFRTTFEQMAVGIAHVAPNGAWLRVNQKLCDILGYSSTQLLETTFQDITYPDDLDLDLAHVGQVLSGEIPAYSIEKRYIHLNGSLVWASLSVSLVRDSSGTPKHFISVVHDITKRKRLEEEVYNHRNQLESLVNERTHELKDKNSQLLIEMKERERIERELIELRHERNRQTLENMSHSLQTSVTARSFGSLSLRESAPMNFDELVSQYGTVIDLALEERAYRVAHNIPQRLRTLADQMGAIKATPRDVVEIHETTLKHKSEGVTLQRADAYIEEGRLIILQLMGYLTAYYRQYSYGISHNKTQRNIGDHNE